MNEEERPSRPLLIGLGILAVGLAISLYVRFGDETPSSADSGIPTFSPGRIDPMPSLGDAEPIPDWIMTPGDDDANVELDPIAVHADEIGRCLEQDRACVTLTHARGAIVGAVPEGDVDAASCIVAALEGARLEESAPRTVRVCITHTKR